jgi:hypothetical protein
MIKITQSKNSLASEQVGRVIKAAHTNHGKHLVNTIKRDLTTGSRSGRIYRINGQDHQASAAGEAPAKITGTLAASVQSRLNQRDLIVGEGASYARYLELGTRKMAARPHILPAIEKSWPHLEKQYRKVGFK